MCGAAIAAIEKAMKAEKKRRTGFPESKKAKATFAPSAKSKAPAGFR